MLTLPRILVLAFAAASPAAAQDSAVESAADAFGERVGTEQSGLYSETQVRGFDLNDSGEIAFRYELANGAFGIAVARVVPEPTSMMLLAAGLLGVRRPVRRFS